MSSSVREISPSFSPDFQGYSDHDESPSIIGTEITDIDDPTLHREIGMRIYQTVFTEFNSECNAQYPQEMAKIDQWILFESSWLPPDPLLNTLPSQPNAPTVFPGFETFTVEIWDQDDTGRSQATSSYDVVPSLNIRAHLAFDESERLGYQFCTPTSQSIYEGRLFGFIPHADDPEFPREQFLAAYNEEKIYPWQVNFHDPDRELLELEVARRMYASGLSFEEIDATKLIRLPLRVTNTDGLLWEVSQRDHIDYFKNQTHELPTSFVPEEYDILNEINIGKTNFCANLNCIMHNCFLHRNPNHYIETIIPNENHISKKRWMPHGQSNRCPYSCYMTLQNLHDTDMDLSNWSTDDRSLLDGVLRLTPETSPCDLSIICRKPCKEIYVYQQQFWLDNPVQDTDYMEEENRLGNRKQRGRKEREDGVDRLLHFKSRPHPCSHKGNCGKDTPECECYRDGFYCQRNCSCSMDCNIRFKGCQCRGGCQTDTCPCQKTHRECDPELCLRCNARGSKWSKAKNRCKNVFLQQEKHHPFEIKPAEFGLGAFALKAIHAETYIGEYIGEIQSAEFANQFDILHHHTGLNYSFEHYIAPLNDLGEYATVTSLDSATIGNETRYLNHSNTAENCEVKYHLVHGDVRLALYTTKYIKKGQELLLNYGPNYWQDLINDIA